jgi:hypothetical protein
LLIKKAILSVSIDDITDPFQKAYAQSKLSRENESIRLLTKSAIATFPSGITPFRGIEKLVRIYFGQGISFVSVRADLRCTNAKVEQYQTLTRTFLDSVKLKLENSIAQLHASR